MQIEIFISELGQRFCNVGNVDENLHAQSLTIYNDFCEFLVNTGSEFISDDLVYENLFVYISEIQDSSQELIYGLHLLIMQSVYIFVRRDKNTKSFDKAYNLALVKFGTNSKVISLFDFWSKHMFQVILNLGD